MNIKVNNKNYKIIFGLKAINYLDEAYSQPMQFSPGYFRNYGDGVNMLTFGLVNKKVSALVNAIKAGTITEDEPLTDDEIQKYIEDRIEKDGGDDQICKDFLSYLLDQPLTKTKARTIISFSTMAEDLGVKPAIFGEQETTKDEPKEETKDEPKKKDKK